MYYIFLCVHLFDYNAERQQNRIGHSNLRAKFMQKQKNRRTESMVMRLYTHVHQLLPHQQFKTILYYQELMS